MRRNEARLLGKHVRQMLKDTPDLNVLVAGDLNDTPRSAPLAEIVGEKRDRVLFDLRPADASGDYWTHYWDDEDMYERLDYLLVSSGMRGEAVPGKTHIVRVPREASGSDHRPVVGVFVAKETRY
jgi:endonuclease/exonuclease/phosphatase family metal-dependent hydrolase